ncbi:uncharacterized protein [Halyomorpha halys]|uniref:uncharacterized protein n=1 Tax=Halyomorpha halys TaxID=286706 RepID=UPI0006D4E118|nr:uncharacterized protein LOC106686024 [Halyomorpha halys]
MFLTAVALVVVVLTVPLHGYDPEDKLLDTVLPREGGSKFEPFYPRGAYGLPNGDSRPPHGHGTFYQHRHPALVDAANAPAYGFRFDGHRRFNFEEEEDEVEEVAPSSD